MSAVTAVVQNVVIERGDDDAHATAVGNLKARHRVHRLTADRRGRWVHDTLDCNLRHRDPEIACATARPSPSRTVAVSQALTTQTTAGVEVTHGVHDVLSSNTISIRRSRMATSTGSTNSTITASFDVVHLYGVFVAYTGRDGPEMDAAPDLDAPRSRGRRERCSEAAGSSSPPRRGSTWSTPRRSPSRRQSGDRDRCAPGASRARECRRHRRARRHRRGPRERSAASPMAG